MHVYFITNATCNNVSITPSKYSLKPFSTMPTKKTTKGRQRIDMTKIKNKSQLQVTFSKRCAGLFKKASELCTLCGVQIALIVFSPAGKPFSFGHPNVESIVNKFLKSTCPQPSSSSSNNESIMKLNRELQWLTEQLETEKIKSEKLDGLRKPGQNQFWWEAPVDELGLAELQQLHIALEDLKWSVESAQVKLLTSDTVNNNSGELSSEGTYYSPDVFDEAFIHPVTSYHIPPTQNYELGFF